MALAAEKEMQHIGASKGCADHDYDLVHELNMRLEAMWRFDQRIANAEDRPELQDFWRCLKRQENSNIDQLKQLIS